MNPQGQPDPTTQYAQLKSAVLGAQQAGGASPLGDFPELQKLYSDTYPLDQKSQQVAGSAYNTNVQVANQQANLAAKQASEQAMLDPGKYQQVPLGDGGYKFIAPNGQEISAYDYSKVTGKDLGSILKQSQNPIDVSFQQDYKNLQDYMNAKIGSANDPNSDAAKQVKAIEDKVQQAYGIDLHKAQISDVIAAFQKAYPTVFSGLPNQGAFVPAGQTFIPPASFGKANMNLGGGSSGGAVGNTNGG